MTRGPASSVLLRSMGSASERRALGYQSMRRGSRTAVRCSPARTRFSRSVIFLDALSVQCGLGWRHDGLLFSVDTSDQIVGRILGTSRGSAERIEALTEAVENELLDSFVSEGGKSQLRQILEVALRIQIWLRRNAIAGLSERVGISAADATALVYLARYDEAAAEDAMRRRATNRGLGGLRYCRSRAPSRCDITNDGRDENVENGAASAARVSDNTASATVSRHRRADMFALG